MRVQVYTNSFSKAIQDDRIKKAFTRLRLKDGSFQQLEALAQVNKMLASKLRLFWVEGPRGGILAVLLAWKRGKKHGYKTSIGVYVDRKHRRKGLGRLLVTNAKDHLKTKLRVSSWSPTSSSFWNSLAPILETGEEI